MGKIQVERGRREEDSSSQKESIRGPDEESKPHRQPDAYRHTKAAMTRLPSLKKRTDKEFRKNQMPPVQMRARLFSLHKKVRLSDWAVFLFSKDQHFQKISFCLI